MLGRIAVAPALDEALDRIGQTVNAVVGALLQRDHRPFCNSVYRSYEITNILVDHRLLFHEPLGEQNKVRLRLGENLYLLAKIGNLAASLRHLPVSPRLPFVHLLKARFKTHLAFQQDLDRPLDFIVCHL